MLHFCVRVPLGTQNCGGFLVAPAGVTGLNIAPRTAKRIEHDNNNNNNNVFDLSYIQKWCLKLCQKST